jgi:hypothetical protein
MSPKRQKYRRNGPKNRPFYELAFKSKFITYYVYRAYDNIKKAANRVHGIYSFINYHHLLTYANFIANRLTKRAPPGMLAFTEGFFFLILFFYIIIYTLPPSAYYAGRGFST